jgi:tetratricopeptide (TPR) repeat protein
MSMLASDKVNLNSVYRLMQNKNYHSAVKKLEDILKNHPDDAGAWYEYSFALLKIGNAEEAIKASRKSATFEGYHKYAMFNLGVAFALLGNQDLALKNINQSMHEGYLNFDRLKNEEPLVTIRKAGHFKFAPEQEYQLFKAYNGIKVPYKTLLPTNYDASKTYKGMIAFPPGNFGKASADWMIDSLLDFETNTDWVITVVLAPKDGLINHPAHHALNDLMKNLRKNYSITENKFHFFGYQNGATPATTYSQMSNSYVTGITTVGNYSWEEWKDSSLSKFENMPSLLLVGKNDTSGIEINQRAYDLIKQKNNKIELKIFDNEGARIQKLEGGRLFSYLK